MISGIEGIKFISIEDFKNAKSGLTPDMDGEDIDFNQFSSNVGDLVDFNTVPQEENGKFLPPAAVNYLIRNLSQPPGFYIDEPEEPSDIFDIVFE